MALDLFIDPDRPRRTSTTLFEQIRDAIVCGRLAPGDRLPTTRDLARDLGVARSTVTTVYGWLSGEGFLTGRTGDGTFVADHHVARAGRHRSTATGAARPRRRIESPPRPAPRRGITIDLRTGRPDPSLFPIVEWRRCVNGALQAPPPDYGHLEGLPALRRALAAWVRRSRGVSAAPEEVLVTAGAQQAFDLCARVLLARGDVVAVEEPGYTPARFAFGYHGARVEAVRVDEDGMVVDEIPRAARAVYVTPSHQSPLGVTMSPTRRRALLAAAAASDVVVIEDDYDTEYRHVDRPIEPLQRLDTSGRVVYVGSFSKTLSPSLRMGFVVAPEPVIAELTNARALADSQPPHLTQAALAAFISSGGLERHLRRSGRTYRARHELLSEHIDRLYVDGVIERPFASHAGLHSTIELLPGTGAAAIADRLATRGVGLDPEGGVVWFGEERPCLKLGFGMAEVEALHRGLLLLRRELETGSARRS
jgi:GntR family transcriptional regulator/MocR family aminotransferase